MVTSAKINPLGLHMRPSQFCLRFSPYEPPVQGHKGFIPLICGRPRFPVLGHTAIKKQTPLSWAEVKFSMFTQAMAFEKIIKFHGAQNDILIKELPHVVTHRQHYSGLSNQSTECSVFPFTLFRPVCILGHANLVADILSKQGLK